MNENEKVEDANEPLTQDSGEKTESTEENLSSGDGSESEIKAE